MSKKSLIAEDELRELARLGKRMRQMQRHAAKARGADKAAVERAEREFDARVVHVLEFRTGDIPFDLTPDQVGNAGAT